VPDDGLRLGLDLRGGIHWVLGVQLDAAERHELEFQADALERILEEDEVSFEKIDVDAGRLVVDVFTETEAVAIRAWGKERDNILSAVSDDGRRLEYELSGDWRREVRERGMRQVLEVLRRRIGDPIKGIPDSVVTRQGDDRILVQIPGGQIERHRAREMLRVTGFLEFKIVQDQAPTEALLRAKYAEGLPEDTMLVFEREKETDRVLTAYLVSTTADVTGDYLTDARVGFDRQQRPIVNFQFNPEGGRIFQELTGENIGEQLAIVLDDRVYSAPVVRSRIASRGQIEGRFTSQEAADLAVVLRSGSLAVPVVIEEERTVGPALGQDSIERGVRAVVVGLLVILVFIIVYYQLSGAYAAVALAANLMLLIGVMSLFEATLTLPGMAGIVLTVGMAVDANVIIFERVREELRSAKTPRGAIGTAFTKAFWTIMDANITTLITALVLFEYGTGPIKGFAVLVITRAMFAIYPGMRHVESLSI
jgi:preprotein translocase subunit SecD